MGKEDMIMKVEGMLVSFLLRFLGFFLFCFFFIDYCIKCGYFVFLIAKGVHYHK